MDRVSGEGGRGEEADLQPRGEEAWALFLLEEKPARRHVGRWEDMKLGGARSSFERTCRERVGGTNEAREQNRLTQGWSEIAGLACRERCELEETQRESEEIRSSWGWRNPSQSRPGGRRALSPRA